jgi:hypothetical protein
MLSAKRLVPLAALAAAVVLLSPPDARAQQPADKEAVNRAVELGVKFVKSKQQPNGSFGVDGGKSRQVGYTALCGLALVECGVPISDPGIKRAATLVRAQASDVESTYDAALGILFLDRMKEKTDKRYIHLLAGRLMAAQMPSGGWGYTLSKNSEAETTALFNAVKKLTPTEKDKATFDPSKARAAALALLPVTMRRLPVLYDPPAQLPNDPKKTVDVFDALTDNSNTHFAMIGLWTARKHDVPVDRTFTLVNRRFRTSQGPGGGWNYPFLRGTDGNGAMVAIGLLGVTIGHVVNPDPEVRPEADPVVLNAFASLSRTVGAPVGDTTNRPTLKASGGLYFFWAMERIAVLYDVQTLNKKDWYLWGAEILICHQLADGSWEEGGYPGGDDKTVNSALANTAIGLMFLRRANLTPDLAKRLIVDRSTLTKKVDEKITPKVEPPPTVKPTVPEIEVAPMPHEPRPKPKPVPTPAPPVPPPAPVPEPIAEQPAKGSALPYILGGIGLLLLLLLLAFLMLRKKGEEDESDDEDEKPVKKSKKAKGKDKGDAKPKKKPKVEVDDDE